MNNGRCGVHEHRADTHNVLQPLHAYLHAGDVGLGAPAFLGTRSRAANITADAVHTIAVRGPGFEKC